MHSTTLPLAARRHAALPVVWAVLGTFVITFDFFAINVAVPSLRDALGAEPAQLQWVVAAFGLMFGSGLIAGARLGDRHGAERVLGGGFALFALASVAAATAGGLAWLIAARAAQGVAAALIAPQVLALAGRTADATQRQRAFVAYGAALGLGAALGPLVGCAILELDPWQLGWRAVFVPQVLLAAVGALRAQPWRAAVGRGPALDGPSVALLASSTMALVVPMIEGRRLQWPWWLALLPLLAALGGVVFWRRQRSLAWHHQGALIEPSLMQPRFLRALLSVLCFYCSNASCILIVSLWLRSVFELRPIAAAAVYTAMSAGFLATTFGARRGFERWGDALVARGAWALAAGQLLIGAQIALAEPLWALLPALLFTGAAFGVVMSPLVAHAVGTVPMAHAALAGGLVGSVQWLGNALGVALIGSIYFGLSAQSPAQAALVSHGLLALLAVGTALLLPHWLGAQATVGAR